MYWVESKKDSMLNNTANGNQYGTADVNVAASSAVSVYRGSYGIGGATDSHEAMAQATHGPGPGAAFGNPPTPATEPPIVLQCKTCKQILGDTSSFVGTIQELGMLVLYRK